MLEFAGFYTSVQVLLSLWTGADCEEEAAVFFMFALKRKSCCEAY